MNAADFNDKRPWPWTVYVMDGPVNWKPLTDLSSSNEEAVDWNAREYSGVNREAVVIVANRLGEITYGPIQGGTTGGIHHDAAVVAKLIQDRSQSFMAWWKSTLAQPVPSTKKLYSLYRLSGPGEFTLIGGNRVLLPVDNELCRMTRTNRDDVFLIADETGVIERGPRRLNDNARTVEADKAIYNSRVQMFKAWWERQHPVAFKLSEELLKDLEAERAYQDGKYGTVHQNPHTPTEWIAILQRELAETLIATQATASSERNTYRSELLQVAAVALAAIEQHDAETSK